MLRLPDYMTRVETKPRESNIVGSFLAGRKYAADEAYRQGQSQLAREKFETDKQYRSEQMDLQKQQFEANQKDKVINLQREQFNNLTARLAKSNMPNEKKERLIKQQLESSPEFKEVLGNSIPIVTDRGRTVFENSGVLTKETLDNLGLPPEERARFEPNIGRHFTANFALTPDGGATLIGPVKFRDAKRDKGSDPDMGNYSSIYNSLSKLKDAVGDPLYKTPDEIIKATQEALRGGVDFINGLQNQGVNITPEIQSLVTEPVEDQAEAFPQELNQEQVDMEQYFQDVTGQAFSSTDPQDRALMDAEVQAQEKAELKRQQGIANIKQQIDEAKEDFEKKTKRTSGPNSILYKQYENEYNSRLDFLRKKIQKEFKASPISRQATTGVGYTLKLEDSVNANIKN